MLDREPLLCASRGATLEGPFGFPGVSPRGLYGPTPAAPMFFTERLHVSHDGVSGSFPVCYTAGNASGHPGTDVSNVCRGPWEQPPNRPISPIPYQGGTSFPGARGCWTAGRQRDLSHVRHGKAGILPLPRRPDLRRARSGRLAERKGHTRCHLPVTVIQQGLEHPGRTVVAFRRAGKRLPARRTRHRRLVCRTGRSRLWTRNRR
jgi:hypothetical protein